MNQEKKYSLWAMPSAEEYEHLKKIISTLSVKHHTASFEPHLTLLGSLALPEEECLAKTAQLASVLSPYKISFDGIGHQELYFRSLFLKARETAEVMNAASEARNIFHRETNDHYFPHLSLLYGHVSPQTKKEIIATLQKEFSLCFEVNSIHLFSTEGEPREWYHVKEFHLPQSSL